MFSKSFIKMISLVIIGLITFSAISSTQTVVARNDNKDSVKVVKETTLDVHKIVIDSSEMKIFIQKYDAYQVKQEKLTKGYKENNEKLFNLLQQQAQQKVIQNGGK